MRSYDVWFPRYALGNRLMFFCQVFSPTMGRGSSALSTFLDCRTQRVKHLLDETKSNIQFIASGQGNIGQSEAEPNIILYGCNELDAGRGQVQ